MLMPTKIICFIVYTMTMKSKLIEANPKHSVDKITSNLT